MAKIATKHGGEHLAVATMAVVDRETAQDEFRNFRRRGRSPSWVPNWWTAKHKAQDLDRWWTFLRQLEALMIMVRTCIRVENVLDFTINSLGIYPQSRSFRFIDGISCHHNGRVLQSCIEPTKGAHIRSTTVCWNSGDCGVHDIYDIHDSSMVIYVIQYRET